MGSPSTAARAEGHKGRPLFTVTMSGGGEIQALVNYYARAGYGRHIQTVCSEVLRKRSGDPTLQFWRTFGMIVEGSYSEAIMQLESLMGCVPLTRASTSRRGIRTERMGKG